MTEQDTYKTIEKPSEEVLFKDKNSKFFGYAFPVSNEDDVKIHIAELKKTHKWLVSLESYTKVVSASKVPAIPINQKKHFHNKKDT